MAGIAALGEILAIHYGESPYALIACVFFWLAVCDYSKKWLEGKKDRFRYGFQILTLLVLMGLTGALVKFSATVQAKPDKNATKEPSTQEDRKPEIKLPLPAPPPRPTPMLRVSRYETLPYRIGEALEVQMYVENKGDSSVTLFGGTHSKLVNNPPRDFDQRRRLETALWAERKRYRDHPNRPLKFQPSITVFAELMSEDALTQDQIDKLAKGSVMYLMTVLKDHIGKTIIESCIYTDPSGGNSNIFFCVDHNSP